MVLDFDIIIKTKNKKSHKKKIERSNEGAIVEMDEKEHRMDKQQSVEERNFSSVC